MKLSNAKIVLKDRIMSGSMVIENGKIALVTTDELSDGFDCAGCFVGPGFIDTHCHGGDDKWFFDDPAAAANFHLQYGTTSMLASLWRNAASGGLISAVTKVVKAIESVQVPNLIGIHMEGPYIDKDFGSEGGTAHPIDANEYRAIIKATKGFIKHWTFDPLQKGAKAFAQVCFGKDIKLSICYSKATPGDIENFAKFGLNIGNHIMCATGKPPTKFAGTIESGSDEYVLANDDMYAELICDSLGAHVRHENVVITYKCKGADKTILVTDYCADGDTLGSDVNIINGELYGSKLTMNTACRNMRAHTGASMPEIFRMASTTAASALGLTDIGAIEKGFVADLVICDEDFNIHGVVKNGELVLNNL
ncbi:MAG: amidohydrolase family protein [Clostridia bacterium]|jgi:N-acetylglucosamine-6-phosphate deacetylase|nr:amidohydrolase family protein [Clostridia bacterium]MBT7122358.1 amidohydrolase family protein [Clostridia bacterium]